MTFLLPDCNYHSWPSCCQTVTITHDLPAATVYFITHCAFHYAIPSAHLPPTPRMIFSRYPAVAKPNAVPVTFTRCQPPRSNPHPASDHHPASHLLPRSDHHLVIDRTLLLLLISGMAASEMVHAKYMHCIIYQVAVLVIVFFYPVPSHVLLKIKNHKRRK